MGNWAYQWLWSNGGVGNFTASAIALLVGGRFLLRKLKPHLERNQEIHRLMLELHEHGLPHAFTDEELEQFKREHPDD